MGRARAARWGQTTIVAAVAVTAIAGSVAYASAPTDDDPPALVSVIEATAPPVTTAPERPAAVELRPVRTTPNPFGERVEAQVQQTIVIPIRSGPLTVTPHHAVVTLQRVGHSRDYRGVLDGVELIDARGSLAGWTLTLVVSGVAADVSRVQPRDVESTIPREVRCTTIFLRGAPAPLCHADAGGGGGTTTLDVEINVSLPAAAGDSVDAAVTFAAS
jgi:hypothetical protein